MKKVLKNVLIYTMFVLCVSCSTKVHKPQDFIEIDNNIMTADDNIFLNKFIEGDIEYVKLESKAEYLLGGNPRIYLKDSTIITIGTNDQIYLFDRTTGKFITKVGKIGRGPNEYKKTLYSYPFDEKKNIIFTKGWQKNCFYVYDTQDSLINQLNILASEDEIVTSIATVNDSLYIGYIWNYNGKQNNKLLIFDNKGSVNIKFPQQNKFEWDLNKDGLNIFNWDGWFYKFNNEAFFLERNADTIYQVSVDEVQPKYVFQSNKIIESVFESERYLFYTFTNYDGRFLGVFDKLTSIAIATPDQSGLLNDIDNFIPFMFHSINQNGEAVGYFQAYEVKKWFNENPEKAANLSPNLQKFISISENDNPIVMIVKLKE